MPRANGSGFVSRILGWSIDTDVPSTDRDSRSGDL